MADAMETLKSAGVQVDQLPPDQQKVLSELSDEEANVLGSIQRKLDAAGSDVEGYRARDDGGLFW
jgi:hypothetical protein